MLKNTNSRTATTFTTDPALVTLDGPDKDALTRPYTWKDEASAREAVTQFQTPGWDMYHVTEHTAPGLEVFAIYREGRLSEGEGEWVLMSVIAFEDDTAARLHRAVRNARPVTVTYTKADGTETVRTIEPTALALTKAGDVIVKAADRLSGEKRSFRLDRVSAYTVHRTRFTVRLEAPAPGKAELAAAFKLLRTEGPLVHSWHKGYFGYRVAGTRAFGPTGWSVVLQLTEDQAHLSPTGTVRVTESDLSPV